MADGNVIGIGNIQKAEGIVFHESNILHPFKGTLVVNCGTIRFHMPDTLSIEH